MAKKKTGRNGLSTFSMHTADPNDAAMIGSLRGEQPQTMSFAAATTALGQVDPETAAKRYLNLALESASVKSLTAPRVGGNVSEMKSLGTVTVPLTRTKIVKFRQNLAGIPVYGSLVSVELDYQNELVGISSSLGTPDGVSPVAKVSPDDALKAIAKAPGYKKDLGDIVPKLHFYFDKANDKWRLVFIAEDVPVRSMGRARALRGLEPLYMDFVIDAHSGKLVAQLPRTPSMAAVTEMAVDGLGVSRQIEVENSGGSKVLLDRKANVQTFDFAFEDPQVHESGLPGRVIKNPPTPWPPAAVSAHANAAAVAAFLRTVLMRNNIDDSGGPMNSSINCVVGDESADGEVWLNAFWNGSQMVYGQTRDASGALLSLAVALDIVGHEMFHGVTDSTARLEYANESGALNESYSDIFGVIIANRPKPVAAWNWNIGERLDNGRPFRNMEDPTEFGQPAHMKNFRKLPNNRNGDWGGVHINSGIHNRAAHLLLTAEGGASAPLFTPEEVAAMFYLTLTQRLSRTSQFVDSRRGVIDSARTLFRALPPANLALRTGAIAAAFDSVGIK